MECLLNLTKKITNQQKIIISKSPDHMKRIHLLSLITLLFFACSKDKDDVSPDSKGGTKYRVTFDIDWNSTNFPIDYLSGAHFSKLIGWSHDGSQTLFKVGSQATAGIKNMAETGATSPLNGEFDELIEKEKGFNYFIGGNLGKGSGSIVLDVEVTEKYPSVTLATMIAPSPDWYIAVVNINLLTNNSFVDQKVVEAKVYDAGTDNGVTFTSKNEVTSPQQSITLFVDVPLGNGSELLSTIATNNLNANSLELKLNIRNANGEILIATKTNVSDSFNGGMITFDLENENLFLENNTKYIFQWYLINGELLGVSSGSSANSTEGRSGFCFNGGYAGQSKLSNSNSLEEFSVWFEHEWNFNIILNGKQ